MRSLRVCSLCRDASTKPSPVGLLPRERYRAWFEALPRAPVCATFGPPNNATPTRATLQTSEAPPKPKSALVSDALDTDDEEGGKTKEDAPSFADIGVCEELCRAIDELGWKKPSDIQVQSIPKALKGHDIIGLAKTGSGKTAAFALPILQVGVGVGWGVGCGAWFSGARGKVCVTPWGMLE